MIFDEDEKKPPIEPKYKSEYEYIKFLYDTARISQTEYYYRWTDLTDLYGTDEPPVYVPDEYELRRFSEPN